MPYSCSNSVGSMRARSTPSMRAPRAGVMGEKVTGMSWPFKTRGMQRFGPRALDQACIARRERQVHEVRTGTLVLAVVQSGVAQVERADAAHPFDEGRAAFGLRLPEALHKRKAGDEAFQRYRCHGQLHFL